MAGGSWLSVTKYLQTTKRPVLTCYSITGYAAFLQLGQTEVHCELQKNCTPKIYRHNFGDCCPILMTLSALWTEIICV